MLGKTAMKATLTISMLALVGLTMPSLAMAECKLVSTKDNSALPIKATDKDTPEAKQFLETCINPYTKLYANDPEKAKAGKKKVVLELGGNAACIVDADQKPRLDFVIARLISGSFYQSGQSCIGVQRILVHASLYDEVKKRFVAATKKLKAGDPKDPETFLGPMIDEAAAQRLEGWIAEAKKAGAKILCGGKRNGSMLDATVLENVPHAAKHSCMEAFGPVAMLEPFDDFDAALATVNESDYGLQAGVFTDNLTHAMRAWDTLVEGGVVVGDIPSFRVDNMPYGGVKLSGFGREGIRYAIEDMTERRLLVIRDP